jgi:hypothetical protein
VDKLPHDPTRQHPHTGNPQYVPEGGNQANECAILRDHPRGSDNDRLGQTTPKGFLLIDQHKGSQEWELPPRRAR